MPLHETCHRGLKPGSTCPGRQFTVLALAALTLCLGAPAAAQSNVASITGIVTDVNGASIPSCEIVIVNMDTGIAQRTITNDDGVFLASSLAPGPYRAEASREGFKKRQIRNLVLQTGQGLRLDIALDLGDVNQSVDVQASIAPLQRESAELSDTFTSEEIRNLPINGRSPYGLLDLSAGMSSTSEDPSSPNYGSGVSVNGGAAFGNSFVVDGATTTHIGGIGERVGSVEAIGEFKVYTHTYSAEFGRTSGATVSFQVKSGTQKYRGSLYEFHRNNAFNANSWASNARGVATTARVRHEFGATLGGPIAKTKKKMFFFVSFEGNRDVSPIEFIRSIPEPSMRGGDFGSSRVVINDPTAGQPFPGNVIPASRLDPAAARFVQLFPTPNSTGNLNATTGIHTNNWISASSQGRPGYYTIGRLDYYLSNKDKLAFTISRVSEGPWEYGSDFPNALNNRQGVMTRNLHRATFSYTRFLGPGLTNEFVAHGQRDPRIVRPTASGFETARDLGIERTAGPDMPNIVLPTYGTFGDSDRQIWFHQPAGLNDSVTWQRGRHTLKFGAQLWQNQFWYISSGDVAGTYNFNGEITGLGAAGRSNVINGLADLLLGAVKTASLSVAQIPVNRTNYNLGLFINDTWKATRKLTLNLGLRYEFETPQVVKNNVYSRVDVQTGELLVAGRNASRTLNVGNDFVNFAPRLGVAYALDRKTVIRTGMAIFFSNLWMYNGQMVSYPGWTASQSFVDQGVGRAQPFTFKQGLPLDGVNVVPDPLARYAASSQQSPLSVGALTYGSDANLPRTTQWNFGIQRSLPFRTVLEVSYVGSAGTHVPWNMPANNPGLKDAPAVVIGRVAPQSVRPFPKASAFNAVYYTGSSDYNSLQVKGTRRFHSGFSLMGAYTFSKNLDNVTIGATNSFQIPWELPGLERGLSSLDRPQTLSLGWAWELPFGRKQRFFPANRTLGRALGGFQVNGLFKTGDAAPFTITQRLDNTVLSAQRPDVTNPAKLDGRVDQPGFSGAALRWLIAPSDANFPFQNSSNVGVGNLARNTGRGPGFVNFNLSLFRDFRLTERMRMQFRLEAFNALNTVNFSRPASTATNNANYGLITGSAPARQVQIGARISF